MCLGFALNTELFRRRGVPRCPVLPKSSAGHFFFLARQLDGLYIDCLCSYICNFMKRTFLTTMKRYCN